MKQIIPNYYKNFKCIADKCKHSCCIGWEIDIDEDTLCYYQSVSGDIKNRIDKSISYDNEPHFILGENDRCPFLNEMGLCDIIIECGEDALCDICTDHPRFRNYYSNCVEVGLGLCCEAVCDVILKNDVPFELENFNLNSDIYTKNERKILAIRTELIDIMKKRTLPLKERYTLMLSKLDCTMPDKSLTEWYDFYYKLERLDHKWTDMLNELKITDFDVFYCTVDNATEIIYEQLTIYFLYRYISQAKNFDNVKKFMCFSILSTQIIMALSKKFNVYDCARMYSSEIEYSDENIKRICDEF